MKLTKKIMVIWILIICIPLVLALTMDNLRYITNSYTGQPDFVRGENQSGTEWTFDNITCTGTATGFGGGGSAWSIVGSDWMINDSNILEWNETLGNDTYVNIGGDTFTGNVIVPNITASQYVKGQPLDGTIGSGVIYASEINSNGNVNTSTTPSLNVTYPDMIVRLVDSANTVTYCNITGATVTVTDNQHSVYYVDTDCTVKSTTFAAYIATDISPGGMTDVINVVAHNNGIDIHKGITVMNKGILQSRKTVLYIGHLGVVSGLGITTGTFPEYSQAVGKYRFIRTTVDTTAQNSTADNVELVSHSGGISTWVYYNRTGINLTHCDNGTDLISCSSNNFRRYLLFTAGFDNSDDTTSLFQLAALDGTTYANIGACLNIEVNPISYSLPVLSDYSAVPVKVYCGKRDDVAWTDNFIDLRSGKAGFGATQDTSIFLTKDGTRPLTANWDAGAYTIDYAGGVIEGNVNMTGENITAIDCITFDSGGQICTGS